jgi:hypothetical protein
MRIESKEPFATEDTEGTEKIQGMLSRYVLANWVGSIDSFQIHGLKNIPLSSVISVPSVADLNCSWVSAEHRSVER